MNSKIGRLAAVTGLALAAAVSLAAMSEPRQNQAPHDIDVILPLSGGTAFLGKAEQESLGIQEKLINRTGGIHGRPPHFVFHDDESSPQVAVQLANDAVARKPSLILGSSQVGMCNAMALLMKDGPVLYCFSPGIHPPAGSYVYTSSVSTGDLANALVRFFRLKGWIRLALITSSDATGQDADRGFDAILALPENRDVKLVAHPHFNPSDVSAAAQVAEVKAADPHAFIAWSTGSPVATVFRAIQQVGLAVPVGTTSGNMTHAQMTQFAAFLPYELYIPSLEWPVDGDPNLSLEPGVAEKQSVFFKAYASAGIVPDEGAALAWDPASILVGALRALPPEATAQQLNAHVQHLTHQPGVAGVYDFVKTPQRGLDISDTIVTRWMPDRQRWVAVARVTGIPLER